MLAPSPQSSTLSATYSGKFELHPPWKHNDPTLSIPQKPHSQPHSNSSFPPDAARTHTIAQECQASELILNLVDSK